MYRRLPYVYGPPPFAKAGTLKLFHPSVCLPQKTLTWLISSEVLMIEHWYWHAWSLWQVLSIGTMWWPWPWLFTYFKVKFVAGLGITILRITDSLYYLHFIDATWPGTWSGRVKCRTFIFLPYMDFFATGVSVFHKHTLSSKENLLCVVGIDLSTSRSEIRYRCSSRLWRTCGTWNAIQDPLLRLSLRLICCKSKKQRTPLICIKKKLSQPNLQGYNSTLS